MSKRNKFVIIYADDTQAWTLANRIKYLRLCRGLSQRMLGQKLGLKAGNTIKMIEDDGNASLIMLQRLAEALDCHLRVTLIPKKDHPATLDFRALRRDGVIGRRPSVKVRDEFRDLVAWSEHQFPAIGARRRAAAHSRATSEKMAYYSRVRAARQKLQHE